MPVNSMNTGGNIQEFGEQLQQRINELTAQLPVGVGVHMVSDQAEVVQVAVHGFTSALFEAVIIVLAGLLVLKAQHCDFIVSLGGGSPHDCAKGIALWAAWVLGSWLGVYFGSDIQDPVAAAVALANLKALRDEGIVRTVKEDTGPYLQRNRRSAAHRAGRGQGAGLARRAVCARQWQ